MIFLKTEPIRTDYLALLQLLEERCTCFSLVLKQSRHGRKKTARELEERLAPYLISEDLVREWPGTILGVGAGVARFGMYRVCPPASEILRSTDGLYKWRLPERPEDLAFYTANGSCFFFSTAHECESMVASADITELEFRARVPGVQVRWQPGART